MLKTSVTRLLRIKYPLIQAGMAGGLTTPELVAAVSNAGGLGTIGGGYLQPEQLRQQIRRVRELTEKPFAVNLFVQPPVQAPDQTVVTWMNDYLNQMRRELGLPEQPKATVADVDFEQQAAIVAEERVPVFSFTFGIPRPDVLRRIQEHSVCIGTATSVDEAVALQQAGVDALVAQGSEAGGHRGTFLGPEERALTGTIALIPQVVDRVQIPVIAAGGIVDGRGLVAALSLGASAVQMGTAFLASPESGAHPLYKQRLIEAEADNTELTRAYSGRLARGIRTEYMRKMAQFTGEIPPYPIQHHLTRDIREAALERGDPEYMSLWAGQAHPLVTTHPAAALVQEVMDVAAATLRSLIHAARP
ncbi:NAD(P)H-dependent flavin oxidoreductase [Alicyclobacillus kakegawensis]|uniref:NAD(P)H-dependent flavin oxidoreductase n=1 Tax=Alicyclobacillus kakegawensis TaxID=392012 RepID=UPI0008342F5D|nr:nitronate monooxygenase [Alicyclobacillus kakegawensis]